MLFQNLATSHREVRPGPPPLDLGSPWVPEHGVIPYDLRHHVGKENRVLVCLCFLRCRSSSLRGVRTLRKPKEAAWRRPPHWRPTANITHETCERIRLRMVPAMEPLLTQALHRRPQTTWRQLHPLGLVRTADHRIRLLNARCGSEKIERYSLTPSFIHSSIHVRHVHCVS